VAGAMHGKGWGGDGRGDSMDAFTRLSDVVSSRDRRPLPLRTLVTLTPHCGWRCCCLCGRERRTHLR